MCKRASSLATSPCNSVNCACSATMPVRIGLHLDVERLRSLWHGLRDRVRARQARARRSQTARVRTRHCFRCCAAASRSRPSSSPKRVISRSALAIVARRSASLASFSAAAVSNARSALKAASSAERACASVAVMRTSIARSSSTRTISGAICSESELKFELRAAPRSVCARASSATEALLWASSASRRACVAASAVCKSASFARASCAPTRCSSSASS